MVSGRQLSATRPITGGDGGGDRSEGSGSGSSLDSKRQRSAARLISGRESGGGGGEVPSVAPGSPALSSASGLAAATVGDTGTDTVVGATNSVSDVTAATAAYLDEACTAKTLNPKP